MAKAVLMTHHVASQRQRSDTGRFRPFLDRRGQTHCNLFLLCTRTSVGNARTRWFIINAGNLVDIVSGTHILLISIQRIGHQSGRDRQADDGSRRLECQSDNFVICLASKGGALLLERQGTASTYIWCQNCRHFSGFFCSMTLFTFGAGQTSENNPMGLCAIEM